MGALSFTLPFTVLLLLPSLSNTYNLGKVITTEPLNNFVDIIHVPKEIRSDNREIELELVDGSTNPLIVLKPTSVRDPTKLNVGFQAEVESKNPLNPIRGGVVQLANQAKWLPLLSESKASKDSLSEEEWSLTRDMTEEPDYYLYIPDVKDTLREKPAKTSMQVGLDVGVTSKKDTDKIDGYWVIDNRSKEKKNYIRLCKTTSLIQKLRGEDCVRVPRSEFYLDSNIWNWKKDDTWNKHGTGLNIKMIDGRIANLLRDGKLSLSASTALKV